MFYWKITMLIVAFLPLKCGNAPEITSETTDNLLVEEVEVIEEIVVGAERSDLYLPQLEGRKVALLVNQTSMVKEQHLADFLVEKEINIVKIFAPEHGFRGTADAGEKVKDGRDIKTSIPIKSLYGKTKKPSATDLANVDIVVFDIQDVGARFYTYISSMHYMMEACAEQNIEFLVLDRPNPNGHYVDGPILDMEHSSFVGMHPVPVVHGMTVAEYARMINGENWLKNGVRCALSIVPCQYYSHQTPYELPVKPSPNLPNIQSIYLYPSLCFFEGTVISAGRGTNMQFQIFGHPNLPKGDYTFTPISMPGAKYPKHENIECNGYDLRKIEMETLQKGGLQLEYLIMAYEQFPDKDKFFNTFFTNLAGGKTLREQIEKGMSAEAIRATWRDGLVVFGEMRYEYLLYD